MAQETPAQRWVARPDGPPAVGQPRKARTEYASGSAPAQRPRQLPRFGTNDLVQRLLAAKVAQHLLWSDHVQGRGDPPRPRLDRRRIAFDPRIEGRLPHDKTAFPVGLCTGDKVLQLGWRIVDFYL